MKIRVLGCSGAIARGNPTTSFLIDGKLLVDAGTGVGDLTIEEMAAIDHVLLTHCHLDHVAGLPLMLDASAALRGGRPVEVHALPETIDALRRHIFNGVIWPDFAAIPTRAPFLRFHPFAVGSALQVGAKQVEVLPALHTVPAVGFSVAEAAGAPCWVFSGDTSPNPPFWQRVNALNVGMLVIETAFGEAEAELAQQSAHLSPATLAGELLQMVAGADYPVYVTHIKPQDASELPREVAWHTEPQGVGLRVRYLEAGQMLAIDAPRS